MKTSEELTRESIEEIVAEYGADAVLVTVLVDSDIEPEEGGDSDTRGGAYFKPKGVCVRDSLLPRPLRCLSWWLRCLRCPCRLR